MAACRAKASATGRRAVTAVQSPSQPRRGCAGDLVGVANKSRRGFRYPFRMSILAAVPRQALLSSLFGAVILATTINLVAGLSSGN